MGKHRLEGGRPPRTALRPPPSRTRPGTHRSEPGNRTRSRVVAATVTVGAFAAVGVPLTADAGSDRLLSAAEQLRLTAAGDDQSPPPALLRTGAPNDSLSESQKLDKSRAMEQERIVRAEAERKAREAADNAAREAAERAAAKQRAAEVRAAAEREAAAQKAAEQATAAKRAAAAPRASGYVKPTEGTFTSGFGSRWGSSHNGIDLANSIGTPIYSVTSGQVVDAGPASGFGQWVRVQHDDGTITVYGHINTIDVSKGQRVTAGQQIATMGNRGQSTGPHLHFEVIENGQKIDPLPWLGRHGIRVQ
jgi:murein DD-endopeptidase MepM/ murein hydrolase activator NlpD